MDRSVLLGFASEAGPLRIAEFQPALGVVFEGRPDASPLNIAIGLHPLPPGLLDVVRRRRDWRDKEFRLDVVLDGGALRLSGYQGDPEGLPAGVYDIAVELESYRFTKPEARVVVQRSGQSVVTFVTKRDRRQVRLLDNLDPRIEAVLTNPASVVDGAPLMDWLRNPVPRAVRKACLLNVLTKLRVPPAPARGFVEPLITAIRNVYFADVDRIYAVASADLVGELDRLVEAGLWTPERSPAAPIHRLLRGSLARMGVSSEDAQRFELISYRQGGRRSLQIVVALPPLDRDPATVYADIDIDLGNPLWDLEGLLVHVSELLDPARTDHFAIGRKLRAGGAGEFLGYEIVA